MASPKVDMFFNMLRGMYGAQKMSLTWPTDMDLQLAKAQWAQEIEKHTERELARAMELTRKLLVTSKMQGEKMDDWPNVPVILANVVKEQAYLPPPPPETEEQRAARKAYNIERLKELRASLGMDN